MSKTKPMTFSDFMLTIWPELKRQLLEIKFHTPEAGSTPRTVRPLLTTKSGATGTGEPTKDREIREEEAGSIIRLRPSVARKP